jgi:DNA-binding NtrC family response regulator
LASVSLFRSGVNPRRGPQHATEPHEQPGLIALVGETPDWPAELGVALRREGYSISHVPRLETVWGLLAGDSLQAVFLASGPLAASDLLLVKRIREVSPRTAVVVVSNTPTDPDLKRAFESGATSFLSWPASSYAIRHAIERSSAVASAASHRLASRR